jgi:hypothetical protein
VLPPVLDSTERSGSSRFDPASPAHALCSGENHSWRRSLQFETGYADCNLHR